MATAAAELTEQIIVEQKDQIQISTKTGENPVKPDTDATAITEQVNMEQGNKVQPQPKLQKCDRCDGDTTEAKVCCENCNKQFCDTHGKEHLFHVSDHKLVPVKAELTAVESTKPKSAARAEAKETGGEKEKKSCEECGIDRMKKKDGSFLQFCAGCALDFNAPKEEKKEEIEVEETEIMDFEIIPVTRDTECGFCYARLDEIEEPRALPCGHTQCTECIYVNYQNKEIECNVCKEVFSEINILALPVVEQDLVSSALAEPVVWIPIHLRCELCITDTTRAAVCCADCKKRLCRKHADEHEIHVSDHAMLPIEDDLTPERYDVVKCKTHIKHVLDEICKHCMKLFCKRCETKEKCPNVANDTWHSSQVAAVLFRIGDACEIGHSSQVAGRFGRRYGDKSGKGKMHEVVPLKQVTEDFRCKLRDQSQGVFDKIQSCRDAEKSAWSRLDDSEEHVERVCKEIDEIADDMIDQVKNERDELKNQLRLHQHNTSNQVAQFIEDLQLKITVLDDMYIYGTNLADRKPDKDVLEEYSTVSKNITQIGGKQESEKQPLSIKPYLHKEAPLVKMNLRMRFPVTSLEYKAAVKTNKYCLGVSWTEDHEIVLATLNQIEVRDGNDLRIDRTINLPEHIKSSSVALVGHNFYTGTFSFHGKQYRAYAGTLEQPTQTVLHSENYKGLPAIQTISANENHIASLDHKNNNVKVYSSTSNDHLFDIKLTEMQNPRRVHLTADSVLVTDILGGKLCKYSLSPSEDPIWTCTGLHQPTGVTTDESGFIYVTGFTSSEIYIISPEGDLFGSISHGKLKEIKCIDDIAIKDGKMALACREQGVMLFHIQ